MWRRKGNYHYTAWRKPFAFSWVRMEMAEKSCWDMANALESSSNSNQIISWWNFLAVLLFYFMVMFIVLYSSITVIHRVGRVLSFFSSRWYWDSPNPSPAGECAPPPLVPGGVAHSLAREGVGESQFRRGDTHVHCGTLYMYVHCAVIYHPICRYQAYRQAVTPPPGRQSKEDHHRQPPQPQQVRTSNDDI